MIVSRNLAFLGTSRRPLGWATGPLGAGLGGWHWYRGRGRGSGRGRGEARAALGAARTYKPSEAHSSQLLSGGCAGGPG